MMVTIVVAFEVQANGVIVSVGGQVAQNIALPLKQNGVRILGTDPDDIDRAEDRHKFSAMLDSIGVDQPSWRELNGLDDALQFAFDTAKVAIFGRGIGSGPVYV